MMIWLLGIVVAPAVPVPPAAAMSARNCLAVVRNVADGAATGSKMSPNPIGYTLAWAFPRLRPLSTPVVLFAAIVLVICVATAMAGFIAVAAPLPGWPPSVKLE